MYVHGDFIVLFLKSCTLDFFNKVSHRKFVYIYCINCNRKSLQIFCDSLYHEISILFVIICLYFRRPIEERVVTAMGKHWHVDHFACAFCEKPFRGNMHYEKNGLAYCYYHFNQLFGALCYHCNGVVEVSLKIKTKSPLYKHKVYKGAQPRP